MTFDFEDTNKNIKVTEEVDEHYRKTSTCQFSEKEVNSDKVRDHCHLKGIYCAAAQNKCNANVTQKRNKITCISLIQ